MCCSANDLRSNNQFKYGNVREGSKEFLDRAQRIVSCTEHPQLPNLLRTTLATRDQIMAGLSKGEMPLHFRKCS